MCSPNCALMSATSARPSMSAEPSASIVMRLPAPPCRASPTMRSISPANVTRPAVPPNSSMTMATGVCRARISPSSRSSAGIVSGTVNASRTSAAEIGRRLAARRRAGRDRRAAARRRCCRGSCDRRATASCAALRDRLQHDRRGGASTASATISVRGTITWPAVRSAKPKTRCSICSSSSSMTPASWLAVTSIFSSSSECTSEWPLGARIPTSARRRCGPCRSARVMNGQKTRMNSSVGRATSERDRLGVLQGHRLRRQLAEHDVKRGDDRRTRSRPRSCAPWSPATAVGPRTAKARAR